MRGRGSLIHHANEHHTEATHTPPPPPLPHSSSPSRFLSLSPLLPIIQLSSIPLPPAPLPPCLPLLIPFSLCPDILALSFIFLLSLPLSLPALLFSSPSSHPFYLLSGIRFSFLNFCLTSYPYSILGLRSPSPPCLSLPSLCYCPPRPPLCRGKQVLSGLKAFR